MTSEGVRDAQTLLKERYRSDWQAALITLKAELAPLHTLTERYRVVFQTLRPPASIDPADLSSVTE